MNMRFFKLYPDAIEAGVGSTDLEIIALDLTQPSNYWIGSWVYMLTGPAAGEVRQVKVFDETKNKLFLDRPLSAPPEDGDLFELFDVFSPIEIHSAINDAQEKGSNYFHPVNQEAPLIVQENRLEYPVTEFTVAPWKLFKVFVEQPTTILRGTATGGSTSVLEDTNNNIQAESGWLVSIFKGTGAGQYRAVASSTSTTVVPVEAFDVAPDATSQYALWNPQEQRRIWKQLMAVRVDRPEFPTLLVFNENLNAYRGMRLRVQYSHKPIPMVDDTDETQVPPDFIVPYAMHLLYRSRMDDNKTDRGRYKALSDEFKAEAMEYGYDNARQDPAGSIWQLNPLDEGGYFQADPLGWWDR